MPNKYSHAFVLSSYGSPGLYGYDRPYIATTTSSSTPVKSSTNSYDTNIRSSRPIHESPKTHASGRLRLGSPPRPARKPSTPPLHRKSSSVETQIYAPIDLPASTSIPNSTKIVDFASQNGEHKEDRYTKHQPWNEGPPHSPKRPASSDSGKVKGTVSPRPSIRIRQYSARQIKPLRLEPEEDDEYTIKAQEIPSHTIPSDQPTTRRHSLAITREGYTDASPKVSADTAYATQRRSQSKTFEQSRRRPQTSHNHPMGGSFGEYMFSGQRPPSPPATPESGKSRESFSLETPVDESFLQTLPPPIPERSPRRSPPGPSPNPSTTEFTKQAEPPRPRTSSSAKSPTSRTFSLTARTSSLNATTSAPKYPPASPTKSTKRSTSDARASEDRRITSPLPIRPFEVDDDDLESLPSTFDFSVMPWTDNNTGPAIFRASELHCQCNSSSNAYQYQPSIPPSSRLQPSEFQPSTRATSFDSAAPPPISLHRRVPDALNAASPTTKPNITDTSKKNNKYSMASLLFSKSTPPTPTSTAIPKSILYSETRCATPPIPVETAKEAGLPQIQLKDERGGRERKRGPPVAVGSRIRSAVRSTSRRRSWFRD